MAKSLRKYNTGCNKADCFVTETHTFALKDSLMDSLALGCSYSLLV